MSYRFALALWLVVIVTSPGIVRGSKLQLAGSESEVNEKAGVVRLIGFAETAYFRAHGRYVTFAELVQSGQIEQIALESTAYRAALQLLDLKSDSQPVPGFTLGLVVAADGRQFKLSLTEPGEKCPVGWFTDEAGILYEGKAVDCPGRTPEPVPTSWSPPDIDAAVPPVRSDTPCPLPQILHETSKRAQELVENLQSFAASERIDDIEFQKNGKIRRSTRQVVNYIAQIEHGPSGAWWVEEDRLGGAEIQRPVLTDTGTAAFALIFHPSKIVNFDSGAEPTKPKPGCH